MKNVVIIMAGGKGERFWPMSRTNMPKQFLNLTDSPLTMIQLTIKRILPLVSSEDIFIVTNSKYKELIYEQLPEIKKDNILFEPLGKNTAPCIGLASTIIKKRYGDANVIALAADHIIKNETIYLSNLELALKYSNLGNIVTLGIVPEHIETGYGYIKLSDRVNNTDMIYKVEKFVEKPDYETAKKYCSSGNYLWNSGMFIWKNSVMLDSFKKYMPDLYKSIEKIYNSLDLEDCSSIINEEYKTIEPESIDYGIMEKSDNIYVIPGNFGWDDVGSWLSVERLRDLDRDSNILDGNIISYNSRNNIVMNKSDKDKLLTLVGMENVIVINTKDAILIMNKDNSQDIKKMLQQLKNTDNEKYL